MKSICSWFKHSLFSYRKYSYIRVCPCSLNLFQPFSVCIDIENLLKDPSSIHRTPTPTPIRFRNRWFITSEKCEGFIAGVPSSPSPQSSFVPLPLRPDKTLKTKRTHLQTTTFFHLIFFNGKTISLVNPFVTTYTTNYTNH